MPLTRATNVNINSGTATSGAVLAADGVGGASWVKQTIPTPEIPIVTGIVLPGAVVYYAMQTAPDGWLVCNGSIVSRLQYPALFAAIGTVYGAGDGVTTFALPDLRGEFIRGWDGGRGVDAGRAFGTLQVDAFKSHNHSVTDPGHSHSSSSTGSNTIASNRSYRVITFFNCGWVAPEPTTLTGGASLAGASTTSSTSGPTSSSTTGISVAATGSIETRPRNVALLPCIKY
jgi:microcystin-dependent protein